MPTARNARGIDLLIYSQDAKRKHTIQVKALSKSPPVPLGGNVDGLFGDFFIICREIASDSPECFVLKPKEVIAGAHRGEKEGRVTFWLQPKAYAVDKYREKWDRIGHGANVVLPSDDA